MQHILRFSLVFASFFCLSAVRGQIGNADSMVRKLFATLPANNQEGFVALYPSPQQLVELVQSILRSDDVQKQLALANKNVNVDSIVQSQLAAMTKPEKVAQMKKDFGEHFQRTIQEGKAKNIDWRKARFVSYTSDTIASATDNDETMLRKLGYKTLKGVIDFSVDTATYQMQFRKIVFIPKEAGWYGGEFGEIIRKGQKFKTEEISAVPPADESDAERAARLKNENKTKTTKKPKS